MISATRYSAAAEIRRQANLAKEMSTLQTSVSTGKRLTAPSDDPSASSRVADIRQSQADQAIWTRNVGTGTGIAAAADNALDSIADIMDRAKELVLSARNDTSSPENRSVIAAELRGLAEDLESYSQTKDPTGRPLFPTGSPLLIPVSSTQKLPATTSREEVFDNVVGVLSLGDILNAAADGMELTDPALRATAINTGISDLDQAAGHIGAVRADQGVRAQRFDDASDQLSSMDDSLTGERNDLEGTDLVYAVAEFKAKELSLNAAQALFVQTSQKSLFDLLG